MIQPATLSSSADAVISRLRPRSIGEIIDQAFRVYRKHFLTFLAIIAVVHVPLQLLIQAITISMLGQINSLTQTSRSGYNTYSDSSLNELFINMGVAYAAVVALSVLYWFFQYLSQGALTAAITDSYLDRPVSFAGAYKAMFRRIGPLLGAVGLQMLIGIGIFVPVFLLFALAIGVSISSSSNGSGALGAMCMAFLLIVPAGIFATYVFVRYTAVVPALMAENLGPIQGLRRSWRLVQNYWWRTIGLLVLLSVLSSVISAGPGYFVAAVVALFTKSLDQTTTSAVVGAVSVITSALFIPIQLASITLYYFDLRTRREGFDLETALTQRYGESGQYGTPNTNLPATPNPYNPAPNTMSPPVLGAGAPLSAYSSDYAPGAPTQPYSPLQNYYPSNFSQHPEAPESDTISSTQEKTNSDS